jgi:hypothetical protein
MQPDNRALPKPNHVLRVLLGSTLELFRCITWLSKAWGMRGKSQWGVCYALGCYGTRE